MCYLARHSDQGVFREEEIPGLVSAALKVRRPDGVARRMTGKSAPHVVAGPKPSAARELPAPDADEGDDEEEPDEGGEDGGASGRVRADVPPYSGSSAWLVVIGQGCAS